MKLIDQIRRDRMTALKNHDATTKRVLTTLAGELETVAKRFNNAITDEDVIKCCKKLIESNKEVMAATKHSSQREDLATECTVLEQYIPQQLNEQQLYDIISATKATNIGEIMKHLKCEYNSQYDGKIAASVAMKYLNNN